MEHPRAGDGLLDQPMWIGLYDPPHLIQVAEIQLEVGQHRIAHLTKQIRHLHLDILVGPDVFRRAFVLQPLSEMVPESLVPGLGRVADLCDACDPWPITRVVE